MVNLCTATRSDGSSFYVYISQTFRQSQAFQKEVQAGKSVNFENYGEIITYGEGSKPPEKVRKEMEEKHNLDHNFEDQLLKQYEEFQAECKKMEKLGVSKKDFVKRKLSEIIKSFSREAQEE